MNKDEEYVRSVWAASPVKQEFDEDGPMNLWSIHEWISSTPLFAYESQDEAWSAAAKFTRERVEQVRQLREAHNKFRFMCSALAPEEWATMEPVDKLATAELTRLTAGMKPEAL